MKEKELKNLAKEVPLEERFPLSVFFGFLGERWKMEFGTGEEIITEKRLSVEPDQKFQNFAHNWAVLGLTVEKGGEWLKKNHPGIYKEFKGKFFSEDEKGTVRLNKEACLADFNLGLEKKIFQGLKVLCIGGIEGRFLADLGAEVVNIDPLVDKAPLAIKREKLTEIPTFFSSKVAQELVAGNGPFDISLSCWFFDRGSGLDPFFRIFGIPLSDEEIEIYKKVLERILSVTKEQGFSIHNGDMVRFAVGNFRICQPYKSFESDEIEGSTISWVIRV